MQFCIAIKNKSFIGVKKKNNLPLLKDFEIIELSGMQYVKERLG